MAEKRFTLIGNFTDNISPKIKSINKGLKGIEKSLSVFDRMGKKGGLGDALKGANSEASKLKTTLRALGKVKLRNLNEGLRSANKEMDLLDKKLSKLSGKDFKFDKSGITAAVKEAQVLGKTIDQVASKGFQFDRSGLQAATQDARVLGREIDQTAQRGFHFDRSGLQAAQQDARVLGEILKANALIQVGQGVVGAGGAGMRAGMGAINRIAAFTRARFQEAANDQLQDIQARGSLFGSLNKEQLFANSKNIKDERELAKLNEQNYDTTRAISRSMESAIADVVKNSTVSTTTITTLSRQLSDNLLPSLLKSREITDLSQFGGPKGRDALDKIMGGDKGVGKELATLYEQMGSVISSPAYAPMAAMGFTQYIGQGTINKQLQIFEQNPVLADAMRKYAAEFGNSVGGRVKALKKALEVAMPEAALVESRSTISGGMQAIGDNLTNATAGILSMGADIANQGKKTLEMAKRTGVIDKQVEAFERRQKEQRIIWAKERTRTDKEWADRAKMEKEQVEKYTKGLVRMYENADSPIEIIAASFGPLMQKFADFLGSAGNLFINPVMTVMEKLQLPIAQLIDNLDALGSDVRGGKRSFAEAFGRIIGEFFKAIATLFNPGGVAEQGGDALQKIFKDFIKGFESINGKMYLDMVLKGLRDMFMKAIFNEGNVLKGLTPLGDGLIKVFALLSAPAFISSVVSAVLPVIFMGVGDLMKGVFGKVKDRAIAYATRMVTPTTIPASELTPSQKLAGMSPGKATVVASPLKQFTGELKQSVVALRSFPSKLMNVARYGFRGGSLVTIIKNFIQGGWAPVISFTKGVGTRFTGFFKGFLGKLSIFGAVLTTIISLFQGKGLAESLAQGAGPLLGAALGAALIPFLGPFGPMIGAAIGGWIGSLESVTQPLTMAFESIIGSGQALFDVLGVIGLLTMDLVNGIAFLITSILNLIPGVNVASKNFDILKFLLVPVTAPFNLLRMSLLLVAEGLANFRNWLVMINPLASKEEREAAAAGARKAAQARNEARRSDDVYYTSMRYGGASGYAQVLERDVAAKRKAMGEAKTEAERNKLNDELFSLTKTLAEARRQAGGQAPTKGGTATPGTAANRTVAQSTSATAQQTRTTAQNTRATTQQAAQINQRSGQQVRETAAVRANTASTTRAVNNLAAKITPQTSLQTSVAAIYNLLASGTLRVNPNSTFGGPGFPLGTPSPSAPFTLPRAQNKPGNWLQFFGGGLPPITSAPATSAKMPDVQPVLEKFGKKVQDVTQVAAQNSAAQKAHLTATKASQTQVISLENNIRKTWGSVNTGSQASMLRSANSLASAINSAAARITVSAASVKKVSAIPASTGFVPGSSSSRMTLGEAITYEQKHKPTGTDLVIANSSERVIPAARGYEPSGGMGAMNLMGSALGRYVAPVGHLGDMADALRKLADMDGIGGGKGSLSMARQIASKMGLIMTSYLRTWPQGSYHTMGRAMDFSDGVSTPGMMRFAKLMIARFGRSLAELIYTPLGFSIKHGRKVPPLSPGNHYDHVHVAFAMGSGNPAFFSSQQEARAWERKMAPSNAAISTVTSNSSEGFGSNKTLHMPITIYQQPYQDAEQLASLVAMKLSMAIDELENHV